MWVGKCIYKTRDAIAAVSLAVAMVLFGIPCLVAGLVFLAAIVVILSILAIGTALGGITCAFAMAVAPIGFKELAKQIESMEKKAG